MGSTRAAQDTHGAGAGRLSEAGKGGGEALRVISYPVPATLPYQPQLDHSKTACPKISTSLFHFCRLVVVVVFFLFFFKRILKEIRG